MSRRNKLLMRAVRRFERAKRPKRYTFAQYFGADVPVWLKWKDAKTGEEHTMEVMMEVMMGKVSFRTPIELEPPRQIPLEPFHEFKTTIPVKGSALAVLLRPDLDNL